MSPSGSADVAWDGVSEFEQWVRFVVCPFPSEHQLMGLINVAYCDESETTGTGPVFTISALLATGPTWFELDRKWRAALVEEGLSDTGFHMVECENRSGAFEGMERFERDRLQQSLIEICNAHPLWSYAIAVKLDDYRPLQPKMDQKFGAIAKPYYLGFRYMVQWLAELLDTNGFNPTECMSLVFDQHQEYQGRAKELYDATRESGAPPSHRMGSLTFSDRRTRPPLQAADIWAYESRAHVRNDLLLGTPVRWQFDLMRSVRGDREMEIRVLKLSALERWAAPLDLSNASSDSAASP